MLRNIKRQIIIKFDKVNKNSNAFVVKVFCPFHYNIIHQNCRFFCHSLILPQIVIDFAKSHFCQAFRNIIQELPASFSKFSLYLVLFVPRFASHKYQFSVLYFFGLIICCVFLCFLGNFLKWRLKLLKLRIMFRGQQNTTLLLHNLHSQFVGENFIRRSIESS